MWNNVCKFCGDNISRAHRLLGIGWLTVEYDIGGKVPADVGFQLLICCHVTDMAFATGGMTSLSVGESGPPKFLSSQQKPTRSI